MFSSSRSLGTLCQALEEFTRRLFMAQDILWLHLDTLAQVNLLIV